MGSDNPPLFLGIAERVQVANHSMDLLGLTTILLQPFYPQRLSGASLVLVYEHASPWMQSSFKIEVVPREYPEGAAAASVSISPPVSDLVTDRNPQPFQSDVVLPHLIKPGDTVSLNTSGCTEAPFRVLPIPSPPTMLMGPATCDVYINNGKARVRLGAFVAGFVQTPPLSDEERALLLQRPASMQSVSLKLGCSSCLDSFRVYLSLDDGFVIPQDGYPGALLSAAPDNWICKCRRAAINLRWAKAGMHEMFRHNLNPQDAEQLGLTLQYKSSAIDGILANYHRLITTNPREEDVQAFMAQHQIIWAFLAPIKVLAKPRLLGQLVADFALLGPDKVLSLVEIEKPQTQLTKHGGGMSAELQKGLDQIASWKSLVQHSFRTLIGELGFREEQVNSVAYIIIAGLTRTTNASHLKVLRNSLAGVQFYTFDELEARLHQIRNRMNKL